MPERKQKPKQKKKQKGNAKPFRYGPKNKRAPDPYYAMLNNIQQQAHMAQVSSLVAELRQAQDFARRARQEAIDDIYRPVTPMEVDEHAPHTRADVGGRSMRQQRPKPMEGITTDRSKPSVRASKPSRMEGMTTDRPAESVRSPKLRSLRATKGPSRMEGMTRGRTSQPDITQARDERERERKGKAPMTREQLEREATQKSTHNRVRKVRASAPHSMSRPDPVHVNSEAGPSQPTNLPPPGVEPALLTPFRFTATEYTHIPAAEREYARTQFHPGNTPRSPRRNATRDIHPANSIEYGPITRDNQSARTSEHSFMYGPYGGESRFRPFYIP